MAAPFAHQSTVLLNRLLLRGRGPGTLVHPARSATGVLRRHGAVRALTTGTLPRRQEAASEEVTLEDFKKTPMEIAQEMTGLKGDESEFDPKIVEVCNKVMKLNTIELIMMMHIIDHRTGGLVTQDIGQWNLGRPGGAAMPAGLSLGDDAAEGGDQAPAEAVKKDVFELKVLGFEDKAKIKVIKEVRSISGLGLKEAKEVVESLPKVIKKDLKKEEAEELLEKLKAAGAEVELV